MLDANILILDIISSSNIFADVMSHTDRHLTDRIFKDLVLL
jgi:hypothetical protein